MMMMFGTITQIHKRWRQAGQPAQTLSCMRSGFVTCLNSRKEFSNGTGSERKQLRAGQIKRRLNDRQQ